jgi:trehalose synthase
VIQKSIREGFGLTVTEALWKARPTIGGRAGGIVAQIGRGDGLARRLGRGVRRRVPRDPRRPGGARRALARQGGRAPRFLMPRLLRDWLALFNRLAGTTGETRSSRRDGRRVARLGSADGGPRS